MRLRSIVCKLAGLLIFGGWILVTAQAAVSVSDQVPVPKPQGYVNDFAGVLSPQEKERLAGLSESLQQATGAEMVFVIMPEIAPYDVETFGLAIFEQWKPGQAGKDNGLLILLAWKERKIRIQTGYGLESILPDGRLGRYRDEYLIPYLQRNRVADGLFNLGLAAAEDIAREAGVTLKQPAAQAIRGRRRANIWFLLALLLIALWFSWWLGQAVRRRGGTGFYSGTTIPTSGGWYRRGGGGFGGGFSGFGGGFSGGGGVSGGW